MHSTKPTAKQLLTAALRGVPQGRARQWLLRLLTAGQGKQSGVAEEKKGRAAGGDSSCERTPADAAP